MINNGVHMVTNLKYLTLPGQPRPSSMSYSSDKTHQFYSPQPMYQTTTMPPSPSSPPYSTYPYSSSPNTYQLPQQQHPQQYPYYTPSPQPGQQFYQPPTAETQFVDEEDEKAETVNLIGGIIMIILGIGLMIIGFNMEGRVRITRNYRTRYY